MKLSPRIHFRGGLCALSFTLVHLVLALSTVAAQSLTGDEHGTSRPARAPAIEAAEAESAGVLSGALAPYTTFESGPVRPLLLTADGKQLLALNTFDGRLEVFDIGPVAATDLGQGGGSQAGTASGGTGSGAAVPPGSTPTGGSVPVAHDGWALRPSGSVFTGLDPVAIAAHPTDPDIVFVSNQVSDTVSVVELSTLRVLAAVDVGDEPQGLVAHGSRVYVACARAPVTPGQPGQVLPGPQDDNVLVAMRANAPYTVISSVQVNVARPRDVVMDGNIVRVIPRDSGNRTTLLSIPDVQALGLEQTMPDTFNPVIDLNPVLLSPDIAFPSFTVGWIIPDVSRIVFDWEHPTAAALPDADVVGVNGQSLVVMPDVTTGVGTTLLGMARDPADGRLWIVGTEARNRVRFESVLTGNAVENIVVVVDPGGAVVENMNLLPPFTAERHAQPVAVTVVDAPWGRRAYVACLGTSAVLMLDAATREVLVEIPTGPLPGGLIVDEARGLLHVLCRGDKTIRTYDAAGDLAELESTPLGYDPEPPAVAAGRMHLYDARVATGHGNGSMSCATCHVFGHADALAWDLGDPGGSFAYYYPDLLGHFPFQLPNSVAAPSQPVNHPMKGPMTTQSLRGLLPADAKDNLPLHWRGDRRFFQNFRNAYVGLHGGTGIDDRQMQEFAIHARHLAWSPNPFQPRDRVYQGLAAAGSDLFGATSGVPGKPLHQGLPDTCIDCHAGELGDETDFTGSTGAVNSGVTQFLNMPTLRGVYEKEMPNLTGFGVLHDGEMSSIRDFFEAVDPNTGLTLAPEFSPAELDAVEAFVREWDTGASPLLGRQVSITSPAGLPGANAFLDLAEVQAQVPLSNVDLVVHVTLQSGVETISLGGVWAEEAGIWGYRMGHGAFLDRAGLVGLLQSGAGSALFTAVPPGTGERFGLDRDEDGLSNFLENAMGTDASVADTDRDGYLDGTELLLGGDPLVVDPRLPDTVRPVILSHGVVDVFSDTATMAFSTDEPTIATVSVTRAGSGAGVASFDTDGLRRTHVMVLYDLPAGTDLEYELVAVDRNGNVTVRGDAFTTRPPMFRVEDIVLQATAMAPYTVVAKVTVTDHTGATVAGVPVNGFFSGDIGGQSFDSEAVTDATGVATFQLGPYTPISSAEVSFAVAFIGTNDFFSPWFVGIGEPDYVPPFFYEQSMNRANWRSVELR